ncbi:SulP family inorganic anion transporter [Ruficoccus amylovorans]|uniref:SulP family inorganic anion transporter n=1 Tax=Ruficoccus amylovorans TaxID=1804625 RepID=UPI001FEA99A5|nr:SulP family inorganic anion transporter [Ruficoccus amylovorans]
MSWKGLELFPIGKVLRQYNLRKAKQDARAAMNVALLDIPQSMAYALIAGLPVQTGIFCASLSTITGPVLASSRFIMLGPSNATAVMLLSVFLSLGYSPGQALIALPLLLLLVAIFMTVGAFCKVAGITQYISKAVICGYITAAAFLIIINQLKTVCGLHVPRAATFVESLGNFSAGLGKTDTDALIVSGITLVSYLLLKRFAKGLPTIALSLVVTAVVVYVLRPYGLEPEMLSGINASSWPLTLPTFQWKEFTEIAGGALAVAFLAMLESSSIAKSLAAQAGDRIDLNQQMLSMGAATFASSLGGGMAVSGSLTRSMLNFRSKPATRMSSVFSGTILIVALFLFGDKIAYLPRAALATLVILVGISLINPEQIRLMLKTTRNDATVFLVTFVGGLILPLDTAIYLGAAISIGLFVRQAARPELREISFDEQGNLLERAPEVQKHRRPEIAIVHVEGDLFFASSDVFLDQMRHLAEHPDLRIIILRMRNARHLDATAASTMMELTRFARSKGSDLIVSGVHPELETVMRQSGLLDLIGEKNFFRYSPENPTISTRDALKRAREITGVDSADITIYTADKGKDHA